MSDKEFINSRAFLRRQTESLLKSPMILWHFIFCSVWMLKSNFESRTIPKCFWWGHVAIILLLNMTGRYVYLFDFWEKITSFACFFGSWVNCIFHWYAQFLIISKSEFRVFWEFLVSMIFEKSEVLSAKILHIDTILFGKLFIYIKNKRGPNTDPWGTPEFLFLQSQFWPFTTTFVFHL